MHLIIIQIFKNFDNLSSYASMNEQSLLNSNIILSHSINLLNIYGQKINEMDEWR